MKPKELLLASISYVLATIGIGTRSDICELIRDSQYVIPDTPDERLNAAVSGALDRLHYEENPCVGYDQERKVWVYLHRDTSVADFMKETKPK